MSPEARRLGHEPETTSVRAIGCLMVGLLAAVAIAAAAVWWYYRLASREDRGPGPPLSDRAVAELRTTDHWIEPETPLAELRRTEAERLERWEWRDLDPPVARVPIEVAMRLLVERPELRPPGADLPVPQSAGVEDRAAIGAGLEGRTEPVEAAP